jgi:hypothetical protein
VSKSFADRRVEPKVFPIRLANALFSLGLLLTLWWLTFLGKIGNVIETTYLILPLLFSYYFLGSAIWVSTDNAALLWVCLTLLLLILSKQPNHENFALPLSGIFAALAVAWRQTHIWLLVPLFLGVVTANRAHQRWKLYLATLLPPLLVIGYFLTIWHGLTPPEFQDQEASTFNIRVSIYVVSLFGLLGFFYIGYLSKELQKIKKGESFWLIVMSLIAGLSLAIVLPTSYDRAFGRSGGWLWEIATRYLPSIYDRSILFFILIPLGLILIGLWFKASFHDKNSTLIFVSMIAWIAAYSASNHIFQRYYEPLILITLSILASRQKDHFRLSYLGPLILAGLMGAISLQQIVFAQ